MLVTSLTTYSAQAESEVEEVKPSKSAPKEKSSKASTSRLQASPVKGTVVGNKVLRAKTRNQGKDMDETKAKKLEENQQKLHDSLQRQGLARYKNSKDGSAGGEGKKWQEFLSYRREDQLQPTMKDKKVRV